MRKRGLSIALVLVLLWSSCGCASRSLGERAIVKMIYLDEADGQIEAGLVVFTCAPNSDTASVEGEAQIFTAQGKSIEEALYHAEQQQNKKAFYAQNELLLLGPGAAENVTHFLAHFAAENAARPNLAAFLTPLRAGEFKECEEVISDVVREGERLIGPGAEEENRTRSIFEIDLTGEEGMNGYLPVFSFSKEEKAFCGVRELVLIRGGKPDGTLRDAPMHLALLLAGKTSRFAVNAEIGGRTFAFDTRQLHVAREPTVQGGRPHLTLRLTGYLNAVSVDGIPVEKDAQPDAARLINEFLEETFFALEEKTFAAGNDVFDSAWWLCQRDANAVHTLRASHTLYELAQIDFESALAPL